MTTPGELFTLTARTYEERVQIGEAPDGYFFSLQTTPLDTYDPFAVSPGGVPGFVFSALDAPRGPYTHQLRIAPLGNGPNDPYLTILTGGLALSVAGPDAVAVPEPAPIVLLTSALALFGFAGWLRQRSGATT